jgi:hypothetical protein
MADVPHLAWPFRLPGRTLAVVEQDDIEDVRQNVHSYLATEKGERPLAPDFGLDDPTFGPGVNTARLSAEIEAAEDGRARVEITATGPDPSGRMAVTVSVALAE